MVLFLWIEIFMFSLLSIKFPEKEENKKIYLSDSLVRYQCNGVKETRFVLNNVWPKWPMSAVVSSCLFKQPIMGDYSLTSNAINPSSQLTPYLIIDFIMITYYWLRTQHWVLHFSIWIVLRDLQLYRKKVGIAENFLISEITRSLACFFLKWIYFFSVRTFYILSLGSRWRK